MEPGDFEGFEGMVDERVGGFGGIAFAPMRLAEPEAELESVVLVECETCAAQD